MAENSPRHEGVGIVNPTIVYSVLAIMLGLFLLIGSVAIFAPEQLLVVSSISVALLPILTSMIALIVTTQQRITALAKHQQETLGTTKDIAQKVDGNFTDMKTQIKELEEKLEVLRAAANYTQGLQAGRLEVAAASAPASEPAKIDTEPAGKEE